MDLVDRFLRQQSLQQCKSSSSARFISAECPAEDPKLLNVVVDVDVNVDDSPSRNIGPRPLRPFHIHLENYRKARERIFNEEPRTS